MGRWCAGSRTGGKVAGFVFATNPTDLLQQIANGEKRNLKKEFQFFATPPEMAKALVFLANLNNTDTILEPSAGQGAIISAINAASFAVPDCYELMDVNVAILKQTTLKYNLIGSDFLAHTGKQYSKIIANPPFTKNQDIDHLMHMYKYLAPEGTLVCITSESWETGTQQKQVQFKNWLHQVGAKIIGIEKGAFKQSGTMVGGKIVVINK